MLLLVLWEAQQEAAAAVGLRGGTAKAAMIRKKRELAQDRWEALVKAARKTAFKGVTDEDYRSPLQERADATDATGSLDTTGHGETSADAPAERRGPPGGTAGETADSQESSREDDQR